MKLINAIFILLFLVFSNEKSFAQIPNPGFETWQNDGLGGYNPTQWWTSNGDLIPWNVFQDSIEKHSGTSSVLLTNIIGIPASLGANFSNSFHPDQLTGYYKSDFASTDTAAIYVKLYYNNLISDSGEIFITTSDSVWTQFTISFPGQFNLVDSVSFYINACHQQNNKFWVDDLSFSIDNAVDKQNDFSFSIYPNPVGEKLLVSSYPLLVNTISIYDVFGREIFHQTSNSQTSNLYMQSLTSGIYFLEIRSDEKYFREKFVKQ